MPGSTRAHRRIAAIFGTVTVVVLAATAGTTHSMAQAYPTAPVRILVPFGAGGATDVVARVFADRLVV